MFDLKIHRKSVFSFILINFSLHLWLPNNQISLHVGVANNQVSLCFKVLDNQISLLLGVPDNCSGGLRPGWEDRFNEQLLGTPKWSKIWLSRTSKQSETLLSGTLKWSEICLSGTPKQSEISILKICELDNLGLFKVN